MHRTQKVPLYVSLKNVEALEASEAVLEHIESELEVIEHHLTLIDCRVTIEGVPYGACRVWVDVSLAEARQASGSASGTDVLRAVAGAFAACCRIAAVA